MTKVSLTTWYIHEPPRIIGALLTDQTIPSLLVNGCDRFKQPGIIAGSVDMSLLTNQNPTF